MWHNLSSPKNGARIPAAPLFIPGIKICNVWHDYPIEEVHDGILDTGASFTAIPIETALALQLNSMGDAPPMETFDRSLKLPSYALFEAKLVIPKWGPFKTTVLACSRKDILLGRDLCEKMLLVVNWRHSGFGMRQASIIDFPLRFLFTKLLPSRSR